MILDLLHHLSEHGGAPVTGIKSHFELSSEMASNLVIQLVDAGFLHEVTLEPCHHLDENGEIKDGGCADSGCGKEGCSSASCAVGDAFAQGCCGMNSPYTITEEGRAFLARMRRLAS